MHLNVISKIPLYIWGAMQLNFGQQVEVLSAVSKWILSLKSMAGLYFLCPPSQTLHIIVGASSDYRG